MARACTLVECVAIAAAAAASVHIVRPHILTLLLLACSPWLGLVCFRPNLALILNETKNKGKEKGMGCLQGKVKDI